MRLLMVGDRITGGVSAYSKIMYETCTRLADIGHKVAHVPMGRANKMGISSFKNVLIYPSGSHPFAEDVAVEFYLKFKADMMVTIKEPWCFTDLHRWAFNFVPMAIIDHSPVSPAITSRLKTAFKVIAVSRFGQRELKQADIESTYIPHGVDTSVYQDLQEHKADCKKLWFFDPDEFVVGIVAMNRARKMIPRMLRGYKRFLELNPDVKSHMMLWTDVRGATEAEEVEMGVSDVGVDLLPEIIQLGLNEKIHWPDRNMVREGIPEWLGENYIGNWDMVKLYNSMDVLLLCTGGEGFGMPLIEAAACGVPSITTDYAAGPENVGAGLTVKANDYIVFNTPGTRYALCDIEKTAEALTKVYNADRQKLAKKARAFSLRYDWNSIMKNHWVPFLDKCEPELRPCIKKDGITSWT